MTKENNSFFYLTDTSLSIINIHMKYIILIRGLNIQNTFLY